MDCNGGVVQILCQAEVVAACGKSRPSRCILGQERSEIIRWQR